MIPVFYSGNKKVYDGLLLSVMSLARRSNEEICVYVLTMDLTFDDPRFEPFTDEQIAILDEVLKKKNENSRAVKVDVTELYKTHLMQGINHKTGYTPYTLLRLLIDLVDDMPDKAIYIDIDTMCVSDIKQLYDLDIEGYDVAAVRDYMGSFWIHKHYCNAGVLLMNLKQIKADGLFEKCRKRVFEHKMIMPDQTALNKYAKKKYLPYRFNEQRKIHKDTVIKHFCKGIVFFLPFGFHIYNIKQWEREKVHQKLKIHYFDDIYEEFDRLKLRKGLPITPEPTKAKGAKRTKSKKLKKRKLNTKKIYGVKI